MKLDILCVDSPRIDIKALTDALLEAGVEIVCLAGMQTADPGFALQAYVEEQGLDLSVVPGAILMSAEGDLVLVFGAVDKVIVPNRAPLATIIELAQSRGGAAVMLLSVESNGWELAHASVVFDFSSSDVYEKTNPVSLSITGTYQADSPENIGIAYTEVDINKFKRYEDVTELMVSHPEAFVPKLNGEDFL
jgi:hypothetical protein